MHSNRHPAPILAIAALLPAVATAAPASSVQSQIQALREIVERQQAQLEAQQRQLEAQKAEIETLKGAAVNTRPVAAETPAVAAEDRQRIDALERQAEQAKIAVQEAPVVRMNGGRVSFASPDGRSTLAMRANVQVDAAHYDQAPAGPLTTDYRRGSVGIGGRENEAARDLSDGAYFRRARIGVEGVIARDFSYRFLAELGGAGTEGAGRINDAYVAYTGLAPFIFQIGAFSPPANLSDGISTEDLLFLERPTPAEISRAMGGADGRIGAGLRVGGPRWLGALTYTTRTVGDAETIDTQRAVVGRLGGLAAIGSDYSVHVGVNGTYVIDPAQTAMIGPTQFALRLRDRPELRVDSTRLIDTGPIEGAGSYATGVEFAANWRNLLLQGENFWYGIERRGSALPDPSFGGWYVEGSWFLTGESRRYSAASAAFQAPKPRIPFDGHGGWGAWELALRYSHMDLNYHEGLPGLAATPDAVRGGEQAILAAGINWYLNSNLKLMFNWLHVDVDRLNPAGPGSPLPFGPSPATPPPGVQIGQDLDIYALRTQFSF